MQTGILNSIADVAGVRVGHCTINRADIQTGVTLIMPCLDNPFLHKLPAASYVINGFGKTAGLVQIDELGQLESPLALTNTLCVGRVHDALVSYMIDSCAADGEHLQSINVVVGECNDAKLNAIAKQSVERSHVLAAIKSASRDVAQGSVGAGRGMVCHGVKGGIGTASRVVSVVNQAYILGGLVLANHGLLKDLTISGERIGKQLAEQLMVDKSPEQGSIIVVLATDAPLDARQLKRIAKRATAGIARVGSHFGNGSGDIVIAFSTANRIAHMSDRQTTEPLQTRKILAEPLLDTLFSATVEVVEDSIVNALKCAESVGNISCLSDLLKRDHA